LSTTSLAVVLDRACEEILQAWEDGRRPTRLIVSPSAYEAITGARHREVQRGFPVLVLDLELALDTDVPDEEAEIQ
jgi:hypothetical protein